MSTDDTTRAPRTSAVFADDNGRTRLYVRPGAVGQDGSLPLYRCNTCGHDVVWATSRRTGRKYLVNVFLGYNRGRYYVKGSVHRCVDYVSPERAIELGLVEAPAPQPPAPVIEDDPFAAGERSAQAHAEVTP